MFTKRFTQFPNDLLRQPLRRLDFTVPGEASGRIVARTDQVVLQELDAHYRLRAVITFDAHPRPFALPGCRRPGPGLLSTPASRAPLDLERAHLAPIAPDLELTVEALGFTTPAHPQTRVNVIVNDQVVDHWTFQAGEDWGPRHAVLSPAVVNRQPALKIVFESPDACSPAELGLSRDVRPLAMNLRKLRLAERGTK